MTTGERASESRVIFQPSDGIVKGETDARDLVQGRWEMSDDDPRIREMRQKLLDSVKILNVENIAGGIDGVTDANVI